MYSITSRPLGSERPSNLTIFLWSNSRQISNSLRKSLVFWTERILSRRLNRLWKVERVCFRKPFDSYKLRAMWHAIWAVVVAAQLDNSEMTLSELFHCCQRHILISRHAHIVIHGYSRVLNKYFKVIGFYHLRLKEAPDWGFCRFALPSRAR